MSAREAIAAADYSLLLPQDLTFPDLLAGRGAFSYLEKPFPVRVGAPLTAAPAAPPDWQHELFPKGLALAWGAFQRLDLDPDRRYGLILGLPNLFSETAYMEAVLPHRRDAEQMARLLPYSFHFAHEFLADQLPRRGPCLRLDAACATGNDVLVAAHQWIQGGVVDDVVVVAASAMVNPVALALFHNLKAISDVDDLSASRPFDLSRRGFVMGEGAAAMWLSRNPPGKPKGYLAGYGMSLSAHHFVEPPPTVDTWLSAARDALAGIPLETLAYISAHGTATRAGDAAETRLLHALLGAHASKVPISSIKSMIGHCLGGAALIEAIVCLEALATGTAPPTIHLNNPDPACDLDFIPNKSRPITGEYALSNAFGFGGHNTCVLLRGAHP